LFGLVLAIGIVVDDAIVVVENVERNIALGFSPFEATKRAMNEVTGPIVATALVLCAVFVPTAFISGLTGQFYKQFAITIAISTVISAFNSLTLSPALCAALLKAHRQRQAGPESQAVLANRPSVPPHPGPLPQGEVEAFLASRSAWRARFVNILRKILPLPKGEGRGEREHGLRPSSGAEASHDDRDPLQRAIDFLFGWLFRPFNRVFAWSGNQYAAGVGGVIRKSGVSLLVYGGLVFLTGWSFNKVPTGFVPTQDKQYLVAFAQLPDASSLDRTEAVIRRMSEIGLKQPGVQDAVAFPGLSISGFSVAPNSGIVFFGLKPFEERKTR